MLQQQNWRVIEDRGPLSPILRSDVQAPPTAKVASSCLGVWGLNSVQGLLSDSCHSFAIACNSPFSGQVCAPLLALSYMCAGCCASKGSHRATLVPIRLRKMHLCCEPIPSDSSAHQAQNDAPFRLRTNFTTHCPCCCLTSPRTRRNITRWWWQVSSWCLSIGLLIGMLPSSYQDVNSSNALRITETLKWNPASCSHRKSRNPPSMNIWIKSWCIK